MQEIAALSLMREPGHPNVLQMVDALANGGFPYLGWALFWNWEHGKGTLYGFVVDSRQCSSSSASLVELVGTGGETVVETTYLAQRKATTVVPGST